MVFHVVEQLVIDRIDVVVVVVKIFVDVCHLGCSRRGSLVVLYVAA